MAENENKANEEVKQEGKAKIEEEKVKKENKETF